MTKTKAYHIENILAASDELGRVTALLQAIDALRPKDARPFDNASAVTTLALEALEVINVLQNGFFDVEEAA